MFNNKQELDEAIKRAMANLACVNLDSKEYTATLQHLERLYALKGNRQRVSPDTVLLVAGNLLGILVIVSYEHGHVIASKGFNLLLKTR